VYRAFYDAIRSLSIELFFLLIIIACGHAGFTRRHSRAGPTSSLFLSRLAHSWTITQPRERKCIARLVSAKLVIIVSLLLHITALRQRAGYLGPVTFTFVGFLLFSVMPRDCVAEIESAAPLCGAQRQRNAAGRKRSPSRMKARGWNDDELRFRDGNARGGSQRLARFDAA